MFRKIGTLSGGQRSRVALARLTLQGSNFLLLDEPTNHLDLASQEILEEVLGHFPGTVLLVSHDRYLVQALATHIWRVAGNELRADKGNYTEYQRQVALENEAEKPPAEAAQGQKPGADLQHDRERARRSAASGKQRRNRLSKSARSRAKPRRWKPRCAN